MNAPVDRGLSPRLAAVCAGLALALVYAASAAPDVTFWDAGEFLAAFATFGIPHPPGTPLFVALGRVWTVTAGAFGAAVAPSGNLFSAACTAGAGACTAWLVARWTRSGACGVAAALCAGTMTTVWANATEAEVYAASLLLACAALIAGECAGAALTAERGARGGSRATAATAYALALAVPLHLSALVVAPAALWLACLPRSVRTLAEARVMIVRRRGTALLGAAVLAAGVGAAHVAPIIVGVAGLLASAIPRRRASPGNAPAVVDALAIAGVTAVALSATLMLLVRARHDPWLNQGDPSTWSRLVEVVGRRQYAVADLWPRRAPWWLQLANLGEWADWQVALGLAPGVEPSWRRTPLTLAFVLLGALGSVWHWTRDRRSWMAVLLLLLAGTVGVASYLNLKAGPSFGVGVLPDAAPHEARERDYFFALGWWAWGMWAGTGAVVATRRLTRSVTRPAGRGTRAFATTLGVCLAAVPLVLNWSAASRARPPAARAAADYARALLENAPAHAVLFVNGDNDTYPLWQAQAARGVRRDVTTVTVSLLPARWYRAELARRAGLLAPHLVDAWLGYGPTVAAIGENATISGRPIAVTLATDDATRSALASVRGGWRLRGLTLVWTPDAATSARAFARDSERIALPPALARVVGATVGDRLALAAAAARAPRIAPAWLRDSTGDGVVAWAYRQLACPGAVLAQLASDTSATGPRSLEGACRAR